MQTHSCGWLLRAVVLHVTLRARVVLASRQRRVGPAVLDPDSMLFVFRVLDFVPIHAGITVLRAGLLHVLAVAAMVHELPGAGIDLGAREHTNTAGVSDGVKEGGVE